MQVGRARAAAVSAVLTLRSPAYALSALSLLSGCAMTDVTTRTVESPRIDRRVRRDPDGPLVTGSWRRDARGYVGTLTWQRCDIVSRWTVVSAKVTRTTPRTDIGLPLVAAGAALALVGGSQAVEFEDRDCSPPPENICRQDTDYNPGAIGAFFVGLGVFTAGTIMVTQKPGIQIQPLTRAPQVETTTDACLLPRDLPELRLALRVAPALFLPVHLDPDATTAHIDIPASVTLPPSTDLPIVVARVPRGAAQLLERGQPIGYVRTAD